MRERIDTATVAPDAMGALFQLSRYARSCGLEASLLHLLDLRASQMNGCAFCIDMHSKDARAAGETEQRLHALVAWREAPFFTDRERAALAWTEAVTDISRSAPSDELFAEVRRQFTEKELVDLTVAVATINAWNRLAISFRPPVGTYEPGAVDL